MSIQQFWRRGPCTLTALVLFSVQFVNGKQLQSFSSHSYKVGESITMYASKIGPYDNPSETYRYYELPFCTAPEGPVKIPGSLGEFLEGDRVVSTAYNLPFATDLEYQVACEKKLAPIEVQNFREAVTQDYYYQMLFDDLPLWGFIGRAGSAGKALLYAHLHFDVLFNEDKVIGLNISADVRTMVDVSEDKEVKVKFSYSTKWTPTTLPFARRLDKYSRLSLLPRNKEIHWFSIMNSCVIVLLLVGFLSTILMRVLKNDCVKYMKDDEVGEEQEESGWKYLHGDVFRFPRPLSLFCAMMGTGTQFLIITTFIFLFAMLDMFYPYNRGTLQSACVVLYALTSGIAGYNAGAWYRILGGVNWARTILLTCVLFLGPLLLLFCFTNSVALAYNSTQALPFSTIVSFILLWALIAFPLTIVGGIMGKNTKDTFQASCRTTKYPREVPPLSWYRQSLAQMTIAGFLPFSAIYIELYYIFVSIWGYNVYIVWSILLVVFVILILVTAFITVALTYFQLAAEDHRWWWRSFLCGGSTGLFVFAYCFYFYFQKSEMYGLLQTSFFFGYMGIVCYALFLMLGSVGFRASLIFVKQIYKVVKCE